MRFWIPPNVKTKKNVLPQRCFPDVCTASPNLKVVAVNYSQACK